MARLTPASSSTVNVESLEDHEAYEVVLAQIVAVEDGEFKGKKFKKVVIDWRFTGGSDTDTIRDWVTIAFGKSRDTGEISKFRQLLNALADQPKETPIKWFDDETLEWSYDGEKASSRLTESLPVIIRGEQRAKEDGTPAFRITVYQSAHKRKPAAGPRPVRESPAEPASEPKVTPVNPDEIPF